MLNSDYADKGERQLRGVQPHADGDVYEGEWKDNEISGKWRRSLWRIAYMAHAKYINDWIKGIQPWRLRLQVNQPAAAALLSVRGNPRELGEGVEPNLHGVYRHVRQLHAGL